MSSWQGLCFICWGRAHRIPSVLPALLTCIYQWQAQSVSCVAAIYLIFSVFVKLSSESPERTQRQSQNCAFVGRFSCRSRHGQNHSKWWLVIKHRCIYQPCDFTQLLDEASPTSFPRTCSAGAKIIQIISSTVQCLTVCSAWVWRENSHLELRALQFRPVGYKSPCKQSGHVTNHQCSFTRHWLQWDNHPQEHLYDSGVTQKKRRKRYICLEFQSGCFPSLTHCNRHQNTGSSVHWQQSFSAAEVSVWLHKGLCWHSPWGNALWCHGPGYSQLCGETMEKCGNNIIRTVSIGWCGPESGCSWNVGRTEVLLLSILGCLVRTLFCGVHLQRGSSNWSTETRSSSLQGNPMYIWDSYTNSLAEFKAPPERCARKCFLTFNAKDAVMRMQTALHSKTYEGVAQEPGEGQLCRNAVVLD